MNLVPIDSAAALPVVAEPNPATGIDFAALMAGLMAGDTQIAPAIDLPVSEEPPTTDGEGDTLGDAVEMLEFIGAPPAGVLLTTVPSEARVGTSVDHSETLDTVDSEADNTADIQPEVAAALHLAPAPQSPAGAVAAPDAEETETAGARVPLASVHSITSRTVSTPAEEKSDEAPDAGDHTIAPLANAGPLTTAGPLTHAAMPSTTSAEHRNGQPEAVSPANASLASVGVAPADDTVALDKPIEPATDIAAAPDLDHEPDLDVSSWLRSADSTARPTSTPSGPVTVGIAQRVEQAIAALATKPDPKIVTLQLDELDGVRLTVALRPDGIHLSSTGEASLTADIERALASRGFDMASGSRQQDGRTAQDRQDDGWKPQAAGRRRRTDQPGITL